MGRIKTRAMFYAMGLVLVLITVFTVTIIQDKQRVLEEKTLSHRQLLKSSFDLAMLETQKGLSSVAYMIAGQNTISEAFADRDRERLYRLVLPYFEKAKSEGKIDLTAFIGADGKHFLRLHAPEKYGDDLTRKRPILAYALRHRIPVSSIDATLYNVALVTLIPIIHEGRFIGLLQVSADIGRVQKRLNRNASIKSAIAFDSAKLAPLLPHTVVKTHDGFTIVSSNDLLFAHLPAAFNYARDQRYTIDAKEYIIASRPLFNYQNDAVAMMMCAFDVTDEISEYRREIIRLLLFSIVLLSVIGFILHYGFTILMRRIDVNAANERQLNEQLRRQLYTDFLTGLPNRNALLHAMEKHPLHALVLLNIDDFKQINDFYGHKVGDGILLAMADLLKKRLKGSPFALYRMPSDEYALALGEPMERSKLEAFLTTLLEDLQARQYDLMGASIYLTFTAGIEIAAETDGGRIHLLANADMALKSAKKRHLNFLLYDDSMRIKEEYQHNIHWSQKVKEAIETERFILHYQPILDHDGHTVIEYEALVRMVDEEGSIIAPALFLPAAKQSRLYPRITRFVIARVFEMLERTPHTYSINLSVDDLLHAPTREFIFQQLETSPHTGRIIFELLESEGIDNYAEVSSFISTVKGFECRIAIDDFGTGYSNFAHILRLNVDILKIDGSLIRHLDTDRHAQTIVSAITSFSKRLGLKTVAEFVHSESVFNACREMEIDYVQGYHLGKPQPL